MQTYLSQTSELQLHEARRNDHQLSERGMRMTYHQSCRTTAAGLLLPLLALFLVIGPIEAFATTWNVSSSGGGCTTLDPNCSTIQGAISGASTGDTIKVFPGIYSETAPIPPSYGSGTVGLYIPTNGLTIQGVDSGGAPITDPGAVEATVNTISNLDFGPDGFFVTGDSVTIAGIRVGTNTGGQNKTIEIWGDNFTLKNCDINDLQGSVYFNDANFDTVLNVSHLQTYRIDGNIFEDGVSLDITNGAGFSGPPSGRVITGNTFRNLATTAGAESWPSVSFNGSDTGVPWFVYSVGGAVITGNTFSDSAPDGQLIRARGTYANAQFDWASYWNGNTFNKAAVVGASPPADVRTYSYPNSYGTFNNVRRIGAIIQGEVDNAQANDMVLVAAGTYAEQVTIDKSVSLHGAGAGSSIIKAPAVLAGDVDGSLNVVTITGAGVNAELSGVSVSGPGPSGCGSINRGIFVRDGANANIHNNAISDIRDEPLSGCQNGQGIFVGKGLGFFTTGTATITNNVITGYQKGGIVVDNTGSSATITGNTVTGVGATPSIAQNGIQVSRGAVASLSGNTVSGNLCNHTSCGPDLLANDQSVGILLYQAGNGTSISANPSVSNNDVGIYNIGTGTIIHGNQVTNNRYEGIFLDQGSATVDMNVVQGGNIGVAAVSFSGASADSSGTLSCNRITGAGIGIKLIDDDTGDAFIPTVTAHTNAIDGNTAGVVNSTSTTMNAQGNWWGCVGGPGSVDCDTVEGDVDFTSPAASVPSCVFCTVAADCDDGLVCNGTETCVGHACQAGAAVNCDDSCNTGACNEPGGTCTAAPKPDGTQCNTGDTCQAGVCTSSTGSLMVATVRLKRNTATNARFDNGSVSVQAVIVDEDTEGGLPGNLVGGGVTLDVQDGSGNFYSPQPIVSLSSCTKNTAGTIVSCKGASGRSKIKATFKKIRYFSHPYGSVWRMTLSGTGLATGSLLPTGPSRVTLHQGSVDRSDNPSDCSPRLGRTLVCHHSS